MTLAFLCPVEQALQPTRPMLIQHLSQIGFVLGDMANAEGDLPFVINGAMTIVIAGFCLANAAIYICVPMEVIRASSTVAVVSPPLHALRWPPCCVTSEMWMQASSALLYIPAPY